MICKNCNKENVDGLKYCFYCGHKFEVDNEAAKDEPIIDNPVDISTDENLNHNTDKQENQIPKVKTGKKAYIGLVAVLSVIVIIVSVALCVVLLRQPNGNTNILEESSSNIIETTSYIVDEEDKEDEITIYDERLIDEADLLSNSEESKLLSKLNRISEDNYTDVIVVTVDSLGEKTGTEYADDFFDDNGYGYGSNNDGILLLVSMEYRDWAISTCGSAINVFSDDILKIMENKFLPKLSKDSYYEAFDTYADLCEAFLTGQEKEYFAKETGFKQVEGSEQVVYADSKKGKLTLVDWSSEVPEKTFETKTVYFGMDGITDSPSEYKSATPKGTFRLGFAFSDEYLDTNLDTVDVTSGMVWVDDPSSDYYNTFQYGSTNNPPLWSSAENTYSIFKNDYNYACILIEHNGDGYTKGKSGKGSAIYLAGKESNVSKSYGDVNITAKDMRKLLSYLDESKNPYIVIK